MLTDVSYLSICLSVSLSLSLSICLCACLYLSPCLSLGQPQREPHSTTAELGAVRPVKAAMPPRLSSTRVFPTVASPLPMIGRPDRPQVTRRIYIYIYIYIAVTTAIMIEAPTDAGPAARTPRCLNAWLRAALLVQRYLSNTACFVLCSFPSCQGSL